MTDDYSDILDLEYTGVRHHARTPVEGRAVIMSAFDALSGMGDKMKQTAAEATIRGLDDGYSDLEEWA